MEVKKQLVETSWFHAGNFLWLFDATGSGWDTKPGVDKSLQLTLTKIEPKQNYKLINKTNRIAILLPEHLQFNKQKSADQLRIDSPGIAVNEQSLKVTETDLNSPASAINLVEGILEDSSRRYNDRWFSINLAALDVNNPQINSIALYRNLNAIRITSAGSVKGNLKLDSANAVAWAIVILTVEIPDEDDLVLQSQANQFGDFLISLNELPALEPDSLVTEFSAFLQVQACSLKMNKPNLNSLVDVTMKNLTEEEFVDLVTFQIKPGEHSVLKSVGSQSIVVKLPV